MLTPDEVGPQNRRHMQATVIFRQCVTDSQEFGSTDEHMVSRVFFDLAIGGKTYTGLYADIKQTVGSDYATADLEVSAPRGYGGPFNHIAFRAAAERFYRMCFGPTAMGVRTMSTGPRVRMRNCSFIIEHIESFDVEGGAGGW